MGLTYDRIVGMDSFLSEPKVILSQITSNLYLSIYLPTLGHGQSKHSLDIMISAFNDGIRVAKP